MSQRLDVRAATPDGRQPHRARRRSKTCVVEVRWFSRHSRLARRGPWCTRSGTPFALRGHGVPAELTLGKKSEGTQIYETKPIPAASPMRCPFRPDNAASVTKAVIGSRKPSARLAVRPMASSVFAAGDYDSCRAQVIESQAYKPRAMVIRPNEYCSLQCPSPTRLKVLPCLTRRCGS
jgi:hypothetical protein